MLFRSWLVTNPITTFDSNPYKETTYLAEKNVPSGCSPVPLAMPSEFHQPDLIESYRSYYLIAKRNIPTKKEAGILDELEREWQISVQ